MTTAVYIQLTFLGDIPHLWPIAVLQE